MISKKLQRARDFEKKYSPYVAEELPKFHVTGAIGWINDPNGFAPYKGEYHLFYLACACTVPARPDFIHQKS